MVSNWSKYMIFFFSFFLTFLAKRKTACIFCCFSTLLIPSLCVFCQQTKGKGVQNIYYLPWTLSRWTIFSIDNADHTSHFGGDWFFDYLMFKRNLGAVALSHLFHVICLIELCRVFISDVLALVPENCPDVFSDVTATFEGFWKNGRKVIFCSLLPWEKVLFYYYSFVWIAAAL